MAQPKYRKSRTRVRRQKAVWLGGGNAPEITICKRCGSYMRTHRVCPGCGYYKNQMILEVKGKEKAG